MSIHDKIYDARILQILFNFVEKKNIYIPAVVVLSDNKACRREH